MLAGADAPATLGAIGSVLPLDLFVDNPVGYMVPSPGNERPPAADEARASAAPPERSERSIARSWSKSLYQE